MRVHSTLGHGFLESVYQAALAVEFEASAIAFRREAPFEIAYRGQRLDVTYRVDFLCFDAVLVELKALPRLTRNEETQVINYLKASGCRRALLLNFGAPSLEYKRLIYTPDNLR
jgi:GxxExxY protein